jgi:hypothetical protein
MTKIQRTFKLSRSLTDQDLENISRMHAVYGFFVVRLLPSGDELFIEYDAARLNPDEVRASLEDHAIPVV